MKNVVTSKQGQWNLRDLSRGLIRAILGAILPIIYEAMNTVIAGGDFEINWNAVLAMAGVAAITYLGPNLTDSSKVIITTSSKEEADQIKKEIIRKGI